MQRKHNLYRDSMVMHNSDPNLHLLGEGTPIDWGEEHGGQPEAEPAADKRRRAKQVVSVIQDDEGALPYEMGAEMLMSPSSPEPPEPRVPPGSPDGVAEIREALAKESTEVLTEERLTNGTHSTRDSGATKEGVVAEGAAPGDVPTKGPAGDGDGVRRAAPAAPTSGAKVSSEDGVPCTPAAPPAPEAESTARDEVQHAMPASPTTGAEVLSQDGLHHDAPASAVSGAEVTSGAEIPSGDKVPRASSASPAPRADVPPSDKVHHGVPASPAPRAETPPGDEVHHATPASPAPRAEVPLPPAGTACQRSDKETGEEVALPVACSPPEPAGTTENIEGMQTEF